MKKLTITIAIILVLALALSAVPVFAGKGEDKPKERHNFGDKIEIDDGYEAVYQGLSVDNRETWQVDFSAPVYVGDGTKTEINCGWKPDGKSYYIDQNLFTTEVEGDTVTVHYEGQSFTWQPVVYVGNKKYKPIDADATQLGYDPINSHQMYYGNTLEWDYGVCKRHLRVIEGVLLEYFIFESDPKGDVRIEYDKHTKSKDFTYEVAPCGWDANGMPIVVGLEGNNKVVRASEFQREGITYPVTIDPTSTFYTSSSDGQIYYRTSYRSWNTVRGASSGTSESSSSPGLWVMVQGTTATLPYYYVMARVFLYFDTSSIPDGATISDAELYLYATDINDDDDAGIYIVSGMPTYPHDPLVLSDYGYTNYGSFSTEYGYVDASEQISANQYEKINYSNNTALKNIINKTGDTRLCLIDRTVKENDAPLGGKDNWVYFYSYEQGEGYRPKLLVTYSGTAPDATTNAASNIGQTTARLNSTIDDDGGEDCRIRFGYGTTSQATIAAYDSQTTWTDYLYNTSETPYENISSLSADQQYYARVEVQNSHSAVASSTEISFTTESSIGTVTNFRAMPSASSIALSWTKASGTSETLVRYKFSGFPSSTSDGTQLYEGTANSTSLSSLEIGTTVYFAAWGKEGVSYSGSSAEVAMTTSLSEDADAEDTLQTPSSVLGWLQDPDETGLANLDPVYSIVNNVADSLGMPRANFWMLCWSVLTIVLGFIVFMLFKSMEGALGVAIVTMVAGVFFGVLPGWFIVIIIAFGLGGWAITTKT